MIKAQEFTRERAIALVQDCYSDLVREVDDGIVLDSSDPWLDIVERRDTAMPRLGGDMAGGWTVALRIGRLEDQWSLRIMPWG